MILFSLSLNDSSQDISVQENMKFVDVIHREHISSINGAEEDPFAAFYSHYLTEEKKSSEYLF